MITTYPQKSELIEKYSENLKTHNVSRNTLKNYVSDINFFFEWLDTICLKNGYMVNSPLDLLSVNGMTIAKDYKQFLTQTVKSENSVNRHLSVLRNFSDWLKSSGLHNFDFAASVTNIKDIVESPKEPLVYEFSKYLLKSDSSRNTIKNYASDVRSFILWINKTLGSQEFNLLTVTPNLITDYLNFININHPTKTVKRKVASLRRLFAWAINSGKLPTNPFDQIIENAFTDKPVSLGAQPAEILIKPIEGIYQSPVEHSNQISNYKFEIKTILPIFILIILLITLAVGSFNSQSMYLIKDVDTRFPKDNSTNTSISNVDKEPLDYGDYVKGYKTENSYISPKNSALEAPTTGQQKVTYSAIRYAKPYPNIEGPSTNGVVNNFDSYYFLDISEAKKNNNYPIFSDLPESFLKSSTDKLIYINSIRAFDEIDTSDKIDDPDDDFDTVGQSTMISGQSETTIHSTSINDSSEIFLTPTSPTDQVLFVKEKGSDYFKVGITHEVDTDINFNWWIVSKISK